MIDTFFADDGISADKGSLRIEQKLEENFCPLSFRITSEDLRASETVGVPHIFSLPLPLIYRSLLSSNGRDTLQRKPFRPNPFVSFGEILKQNKQEKYQKGVLARAVVLFGIIIIYVTLADDVAF